MSFTSKSYKLAWDEAIPAYQGARFAQIAASALKTADTRPAMFLKKHGLAGSADGGSAIPCHRAEKEQNSVP